MKAPRDLAARSFPLCMAAAWRTTWRTQARLGGLCPHRANDARRGTHAHVRKGPRNAIEITLFR